MEYQLSLTADYSQPYVKVGVRVVDTLPEIGDANTVEKPIVLSVDVSETAFANHEFIHPDGGCRESYIPAALLNQYGPPETVRIFRDLPSPPKKRKKPPEGGTPLEL